MLFRKTRADTEYEKQEKSTSFAEPPMTRWNTRATGNVKCICCQTLRSPGAFPMIPGNILGFLDAEGHRRSLYCTRCVEHIFRYLLESEEGGDKYKALYKVCCITNAYYNDDLAHKVFGETHYFDDDTEVSKNIPITYLYFRALMELSEYNDKTYLSSDNASFDAMLRTQKQQGEVDVMSEEDRENRLRIISTFHRDVFEKEPIEERKLLMANLVTMIDESMAEDFVRQEAAIEIVRTFRRIDKMGEVIEKLSRETSDFIANADILKKLTESKKKETDMITAFSKDHGFAEKYALSKSRGAGTLGAIIRDMNSKGYDKGAVNCYDIKTAKAMQQVSDISFKSVFNQVALADSDYAEMVREQAKYIRDQDDKMERLTEELRLVKEKIVKQELLEELAEDLRAKGIEDEEIQAIVEGELTRRTRFDYAQGV